MPHWREMMSSDKLYAADLDGQERIVTITRVVQGEYPDHENPNKKLKKPDVFFREFSKPLGLNSTNARAISKLLGSPKTENWIGRQITLYPTETKAFGEMHECIRVKNRLPPQQQQQQSRPQQAQRPSQQAQRPPADHPNAPPPADEAAEIARLEREAAQREGKR